MTPLLLVLWREKHPEGKEQLHLPLKDGLLPPVEQPQLAFAAKPKVPVPVRPFGAEREGKRCTGDGCEYDHVVNDVSETPAIDIVILIVDFDSTSVDEPLIKKSGLKRLTKDRL